MLYVELISIFRIKKPGQGQIRFVVAQHVNIYLGRPQVCATLIAISSKYKNPAYILIICVRKSFYEERIRK